jgi:hypothetical protein
MIRQLFARSFRTSKWRWSRTSCLPTSVIELHQRFGKHWIGYASGRRRGRAWPDWGIGGPQTDGKVRRLRTVR